MTSDAFAETARELDRSRPVRFRVRRAVRGGALRVLRTRRLEPAPGVRIVHYHHVFPDERAGFERQLELFAREHEPVSLTEAAARLREGRVEGRELVVTFDDGLRNQLEHAAPLLAERGISACFFLVTGLLEADAAEARRFCRDRLHLPRPVEPLGWDDLPRFLELGHEVGSHSRTHRNLAALDAPELDVELRASRAELEERLGRAVAHFSAPYGDAARLSAAVPDAARTAGYETCATALRGRNEGTADLYALRRDHLIAAWPAADVRYFLARS